MRIDKHIDKDNWYEIKDILPHITEIESLNLSRLGLTEFPKMSHITIKGYFDCLYNQIASFKDCPQINGNFYCCHNQITSFKNCPNINGFFDCSYNQITSFKNCPIINSYFICHNNKITSFKDCPEFGGNLYSQVNIFNKVQQYSKEKKISLLEAQVELYNQQDKEILAHIDKFPDIKAYIRLKELNKLLCA